MGGNQPFNNDRKTCDVWAIVISGDFNEVEVRQTEEEALQCADTYLRDYLIEGGMPLDEVRGMDEKDTFTYYIECEDSDPYIGWMKGPKGVDIHLHRVMFNVTLDPFEREIVRMGYKYKRMLSSCSNFVCLRVEEGRPSVLAVLTSDKQQDAREVCELDRERMPGSSYFAYEIQRWGKGKSLVPEEVWRMVGSERKWRREA